MSDITRSCVDCRTKACHEKGQPFPEFCLTKSLPKEVLEDAMQQYEIEENRKLAIAAAEVEADNYCKMTRLEETIEFAKKLGAKKIGIATCLGLIPESGIVAKVLRHHGFEVFGAACKSGIQKKVDIGIPQRCEAVGQNMCNPILQAKRLNDEKTDLNILVGLCVGHDSLFYKYSEAPVTTLVAKDRVLGHNTVAAIYQADKYYEKKLFSAE